MASMLSVMTACSKSGDKAAADKEKKAEPAQTASAPAPQAMPPGHPAIGAMGKAPASAATHKGKVISITQAAGYTYLEVETEGNKLWMASSPVNAKAGDTVSWGDGAMMHNFTSKTLHRTFDQILFVQSVSVVN